MSFCCAPVCDPQAAALLHRLGLRADSDLTSMTWLCACYNNSAAAIDIE